MSKANVIGENIRRIRVRNGETQERLGKVIGYGATTIANYESGYRQPDIQTLIKIADHFGVSINELIQ